MGLKQDIVVRSEYTNNARSAPGKGSRGSSPGQYVMRYMAREDATEVLAPVRQVASAEIPITTTQTSDGYDGAGFMRYITRSDATEQLKSKQDEDLQDADAYGSPFVLKHKFKRIDKQSGRAFGTRGISLSHKELEYTSKVIQDAFDVGHSVQKIIVSFTEDYLRDTGVLNPRFKHKGRGSYKGHIDQLKLRQAITDGVDHMTKAGRFSNPEWVGTIQLDTSHVHAHIALVDKEFSTFRMRDDGADRGKINEREKKMFRKGVHFSLEDMKDLKSFHKQASLERQNVVAFVKDYAYNTLSENTSIQLLMAALPKDRSSWRYRTNRTSMKHPNTIAKGIVAHVFETEPEQSGYADAIQAVHDYAEESMVKNKLTSEERQELVDEGRERIVERSVNGLYKSLKEFGSSALRVRTTMTDIQSSSDEELANALKSQDAEEFDAAAFTLRVRGYNKRQELHTKSARDHFEMASEYDTANDQGLVDDTAHVMRLYYEEEQRYHMGLADKYRKFLSFHHPKEREYVQALRPMYEDLTQRYQTIQSDETETGLTLHEDRDAYKRDLRAYTFHCFEHGVASLKEWDAITDYDTELGSINTRFVLPVRPKTRQENLKDDHFRQVKAWDVHHLGLDYYNHPDARIDATNAKAFANAWQGRKQRVDAARMYVTATGQGLPALDRSEADIASMEMVVDKAVKEGLIQTVTIDDLTPLHEGDRRQLYTIPVDHSMDMTKQVRNTLEHIEAVEQIEEELE
ncbi:relaxase MobL [Virgibacillus sp. AGTR]|uniref:relaxase MobL n=1 Tax=Virgibacillus sp. AGTR TaxID=2812055 RepID=UPI001D163410|nr:relaxase MobL [Virgibacillus sp. AGTR]MCC2248984.1 relaxase MobL [Virgibacillus sp. AGTR]